MHSRNIDYGREQKTRFVSNLFFAVDTMFMSASQREIDFVAQRGSEKTRAQSATTFRAGNISFKLSDLRDAYPK